MDKNLDNYIKQYNTIEKDICKEIVDELEQADFGLHTYYDNQASKYISSDKELFVSYAVTKHHDLLMKKVWDAIQQYYLDVRFSWFTSWAGYSNIRYNKYPVGSQMNIHCDHIHTLFPGERKGVPILSIVGCLNEEFLGGRFIMFDNEEIYLNVGDILIFPSNFLYPHKVTEVTDGTRYSFVSWTW